MGLGRTVLKLNEQQLEELKEQMQELLRQAADHPDGDGVWTTVVWAAVDREDRTPHSTKEDQP